MRVLVAAMPFAGRRWLDRFTAVGATGLPWQQAPDFDGTDLTATFPQVGAGRGPRAVTSNNEHVFLRTGPAQARDLLAAGPFDVLVSDQLAIGSALAAEVTGAPWASVALVPLGLTSRDLPPFGLGLLPGRGRLGRARDAALRRMTGLTLGRRLDRVTAGVRAELGLPPDRVGALDAFYSPQLVLAHGVPELEYPRRDLPRQIHFVGQLAAPPSGTAVPEWWQWLVADGDPVVHVTQGTYDVDPRDLLVPALAGLSGMEAGWLRRPAASPCRPPRCRPTPGRRHSCPTASCSAAPPSW